MIDRVRYGASVFSLEAEGQTAAGEIEQCDLWRPQIAGAHCPSQLKRFHDQSGNLGNSRSDVQAMAARGQTLQQNFGELDSELLRGFPAFLPKGLPAFITINGAEGRIIEDVEDMSDGVEGRLAETGQNMSTARSTSGEYSIRGGRANPWQAVWWGFPVPQSFSGLYLKT